MNNKTKENALKMVHTAVGNLQALVNSVLKRTWKPILLPLPGESLFRFLLFLSLPRNLFTTSGHNHTWSVNIVTSFVTVTCYFYATSQNEFQCCCLYGWI